MAALKAQIEHDLKEAMLARNQIKADTLRMLKSAIKYLEIEKKAEADAEMLIEVISREIKKRREAAEQFRNNGREEAAAKEEEEAGFLLKYLPEQLSEAEVRRLVKEAIQQVGASGPSDMGKVMGALMPKVKGKADGTLVSKLVKESLAG
ncbi:MAG: aspartyl-tRNA amidotransferase [Candidatus Abawacabacteria bacterium RIFCSPHIGHO2_01_FULL_46_8]|uniref:Aspartyl-tRNA amidotransferase n=1 Tax=Candidatus Abawacabacteria bacterium RIFCSPHIGHO2_01_FULL_46_8 TaxID=1817815 RepID=A0A1F4XJX7_9BACT|nr:MAG: aspartyl-tRNA amidotransferase [Candidatus Abawacabacteria bacterium RIFCSPHIGHO2_01_FULL_46_8]